MHMNLFILFNELLIVCSRWSR